MNVKSFFFEKARVTEAVNKISKPPGYCSDVLLFRNMECGSRHWFKDRGAA